MKITRIRAFVLAIVHVQFTLATAAISRDLEVTCNSCCQGPAGIPGFPGSNGNHGQHGPVGPKGDAGSPGEVGKPGAKGDTGSVGEHGAEGERGQNGEQGVGQPGKQGPQGMPGTNGLKGERGGHGPAGRTGEPGTKGDNGSDGLVGGQGAKGDLGLKGEQGIGQPGRQGPHGMPGIIGLKGERGEPGPDGPTGEADECGTRRSAFTAVRKTSFSPPSVWYSLPFEELLFLEEGTDFKLTNGTFTCTVPGIYVFMFSVLKLLSEPVLEVQLTKNRNPVVTGAVHAAGYHQESSSVVISLRYRDTVHLAIYGAVYSDYRHYTSFTGFLLYEI